MSGRMVRWWACMRTTRSISCGRTTPTARQCIAQQWHERARPVFATDDTGAKVWEAHYLPFGGVVASSGPNANLRFPGQWFQSESGLHQNWDYLLGRWAAGVALGSRAKLKDVGRIRQLFGVETAGLSVNTLAGFGDAGYAAVKTGGNPVAVTLGLLGNPEMIDDGELPCNCQEKFREYGYRS